MTILTFSFARDLPEHPLMAGDYGTQAILQVRSPNGCHGFWVPVGSQADSNAPWNQMFEAANGGALVKMNVTPDQHHVIAGLFLGYRELSSEGPNHAELYATFTARLRAICNVLNEDEDAEGRLKAVVEWLHDILPKDVFVHVPFYWKEEAGGESEQAFEQAVRESPYIHREARTTLLQLERAGAYIESLDPREDVRKEWVGMQVELMTRSMSTSRNPLDFVRGMLTWLKDKIPEDVYTDILNVQEGGRGR